MSGRIAKLLSLALALALVGLAGVGLRYATAQEGQEADERQERRERAEEERARTERDRARRAGEVRAFRMIGPMASGAWLGVRIEEVDEETVQRLRLPEERGARIDDVVEDGPASAAGLREDDVIVRWNDQRVESAVQLQRLVRETPPGRTAQLGVVRDGQEREIRVELAEREMPRVSVRPPRPGDAPRAERLRARMRDGLGPMERAGFVFARRARLGISLQSLTPQLGEYFGVEDGRGALVAGVREDTPAARAGLRAGDVILRVGDREVESPADVVRGIHRRDAGPVELRILRDGQERTLTVELEEAPEGDGEGAFRWFGPDGWDEVVVHFDGIEIPEIDLPTIEIPAIDMSEIDLPAIRIPAFEMPEIELDLPSFELAPIEVPVPPQRTMEIRV